MSEQGSGAASGAMKGAATGTAIMPGVGTVVGAVVGAAFGAIGGQQAKKARKYANAAKKLERKMSYLDAGIQRRDMVREMRVARAQGIAASAAEGEGGLQSSAPQGATSSLGAQFGFNLGYFDRRIVDFSTMQSYVDKAGRYARRAGETMALFDAALSLAGSFGKAPTPSQQSYGPLAGGYSFPGGSPPSSIPQPAPSWTGNYISNLPSYRR